MSNETDAVLRDAIEAALERDGNEKTSPTEVCRQLGAVWRSWSGRERPAADVFDRVCDFASRSSEYRFRVRGNIRLIVRRGSAADERLLKREQKEAAKVEARRAKWKAEQLAAMDRLRAAAAARAARSVVCEICRGQIPQADIAEFQETAGDKSLPCCCADCAALSYLDEKAVRNA